MRIISGKLKGKSIAFIRSKITRPLKDSVKENIFNIITHSNLLNINLEKSNILDLYSGIGSFGLECISRGANKIIFVEKNKNAAETLNKNLSALSIENKAVVMNEEIKDFLNRKQFKKFDIFFLDPPFADNNFIGELKLIKQKKIYQNNHIIIIHREKRSLDNFKKIIKPIIIKEYGRSKIIFAKFLD
tara:strand:+ start:167 stop:730 length:564 start_codon:yes stop_codon:yes gene_type:complete